MIGRLHQGFSKDLQSMVYLHRQLEVFCQQQSVTMNLLGLGSSITKAFDNLAYTAVCCRNFWVKQHSVNMMFLLRPDAIDLEDLINLYSLSLHPKISHHQHPKDANRIMIMPHRFLRQSMTMKTMMCQTEKFFDTVDPIQGTLNLLGAVFGTLYMPPG